ncbi:hypothetical protein BST61_g3526 [Cercospora zeina]
MGKPQLNVPTSYQWISLPAQPVETVHVAWSESFKKRTATYFKCTGYWGQLNGKYNFSPNDLNGRGAVSLPGYKVQPQGIVDVYVASQFVLQNFCDGPMEAFHLGNLAGTHKWVTMELNDCFEYGQDTNHKSRKLERFIVYHPSVVPGVPTPNMFQHRFTGTIADGLPDSLDEITHLLPKENGVRMAGQLSSKTFSYLFEWGKSVAGDPLHAFLDRRMRAAIGEHAQKKAGLEKTQIDLLLWISVCAQSVEAETVKQKNAESKKQEPARAKEVAIAIQALGREKQIHKEISEVISQQNVNLERAAALAVQIGQVTVKGTANEAEKKESTEANKPVQDSKATAENKEQSSEPPVGDDAFIKKTEERSDVTKEDRNYFNGLLEDLKAGDVFFNGTLGLPKVVGPNSSIGDSGEANPAGARQQSQGLQSTATKAPSQHITRPKSPATQDAESGNPHAAAESESLVRSPAEEILAKKARNIERARFMIRSNVSQPLGGKKSSESSLAQTDLKRKNVGT